MTGSKSFLAIFLLLCGVLLSACAGMTAYKEQPRISLVSIEPAEMGLLEQRYSLRLRILNPNDRVIQLKGLSYTLEINEREFAYGVSKQAVDIPEFGEALLDVDVVSSLLGVMRQLQELGSNSRDSLTYRLKGTLNLVNNRRLPFDYRGELSYLSSTVSVPDPVN